MGLLAVVVGGWCPPVVRRCRVIGGSRRRVSVALGDRCVEPGGRLRRRGFALGATLRCWTLSPRYGAAEKVAQTILDEFKDGGPREVSYRDIMARVREMRIPFKGGDIADWPPPTYTRKASRSGSGSHAAPHNR
jgi:hypothetical protein